MKKIVDLVNQMGGVFNITDTSFAPIPKKILANFIDVNNEKYKDYLEFLSFFGGATMFEKEYEIQSINQKAEYFDLSKKWNIEIKLGKSDFGCILGEGKEYKEHLTISYNMDFFKQRIPKGFLIISTNNFGDLILLFTIGENLGKLYFWDGHNDVDEDEFFNDYGIKMPEEVKFRNMFCIGLNLYDCFNRMKPVG